MRLTEQDDEREEGASDDVRICERVRRDAAGVAFLWYT